MPTAKTAKKAAPVKKVVKKAAAPKAPVAKKAAPKAKAVVPSGDANAHYEKCKAAHAKALAKFGKDAPETRKAFGAKMAAAKARPKK